MGDLYLNFSNKFGGNTKKIIDSIKKEEDEYIYVNNYKECIDCKQCINKECILKDNEEFLLLINKILEFKNIYFCTPVYCNMPTPKLMSFISRASMLSEQKYERKLFNNCTAYIVCNTDVSGCQSTANVLLGALNMVGFNFKSRAVLTYVNNWKDGKIRGGDINNINIIDNSNFKTFSDG